MCLVVFAWKTHPDYKLIVAANRDEFHRRPTQSAQWWSDQPDVLGGRDLQAGGTWLAVSRTGRFATVTNYRELKRRKPGMRSRGDLVSDFVSSQEAATTTLTSIDGAQYAGFNLLAADSDTLCYVSNRGDSTVSLTPGVYGLSNASLDTPWSKVTRCRDALGELLKSGNANQTELLRLLKDTLPATIDEVERSSEYRDESVELSFSTERALTAPFIVSAEYGTRCSTVVHIANSGKVTFSEHRFDEKGDSQGNSQFSFDSE